MSLEPTFSADFEQFVKQRGYDPRAHRPVLAYFRKLWAGAPRDRAFEAKSLSGDLGFRTLNLAELVVAMSREIDLPVDKAVEFLSIGTGPEPLSEGVLAGKIADMVGVRTEEQRARSVLDDAESSRTAVMPLKAPIDHVGTLIKFCRAIEQYCREGRPSKFPR